MTDKTKTLRTARPSDVPWEKRPHVQVAIAAQISGLSSSSIYALAGAGRLRLVKLAGRTLVDTASLKALIAQAEDWTPSARGAAARAKRAKVQAAPTL